MAGQTSVTVRVVTNRIPEAQSAMHKAVVDQVAKSAYEVEARAKQLSPVLTGTLRRSITTQIATGGLRAVVGPSVSYGIWVEFGSRHGAAQPYMRPAAALVLPRFADQLKAILRGSR